MINLKHISDEEIYLNELNNLNNWDELSSKYELSENIIEQFANKVNWNAISKNQKLSVTFIKQ